MASDMTDGCGPLPGGIRVERIARAERHRLDVPGSVDTTVLRQEVVIVNLSRSGCLIRCPAQLQLGETITIRLPAVGNRRGQVRRVHEDTYGCAFDALLHPAELRAACAVPEPEDVGEMRRRIRDAMARGDADRAATTRPGLPSRLASRLSALRRGKQPD